MDTLVARSLDHKPILLSSKINEQRPRERHKVFIYEAKWGMDEECDQIIKAEWSLRDASARPTTTFQKKLKLCNGVLNK